MVLQFSLRKFQGGIHGKAFAQAILEDVVQHETELEAFMGEVAKDRHFLKILKEACGFKL